MNQPPPLPPSQSAKKNAGWWIVLAVFLALGSMAILGGIGYFSFKRHYNEQKAREVEKDFERAEAEGRKRLAEQLEKGDFSVDSSNGDHVKERFDKLASLKTGDEAASYRALSAVMGKIQQHNTDYDAALEKLEAEKVFDYPFEDQATLKKHREMVRAFQEIVGRWTQAVENAEELIRADLQAAKMPERRVDEVIKGFQTGQDKRVLQIKLLQLDKEVCTAVLARIDLLEAQWGKWKRDEEGALVFDEDAAADRFNELGGKIDEIAEEQTETQKELARKLIQTN